MVNRIEPAVGSTSGIPDTLLVRQELLHFVEFKSLEGDGLFTIRPTQRLWHKAFCQHSEASSFCIVNQEGWWMMSSAKALERNQVVGLPVLWSHTTDRVVYDAVQLCRISPRIYGAAAFEGLKTTIGS
jgi:hypothetical protein